MGKQDGRIEFKNSQDGIVELHYYDQPGKKSYLSWKMPISEACDLTKWWEKEGKKLCKRQMPVVNRKSRSVLISMYTHTRIDVRGFDRHGGLKLLGYSLPGKVVECLNSWLLDRQQSQNTDNGVKDQTCSTKC